MKRLTAEVELECLAAGYEARYKHCMDEFWKDRRRRSLVTRAEAFRDAAEQARHAIRRLKLETKE